MKKWERREKKRKKREALQFRRFERRGGWGKMRRALKEYYSSFAPMINNAYRDCILFGEGQLKLSSDFCGKVVNVPISYKNEATISGWPLDMPDYLKGKV